MIDSDNWLAQRCRASRSKSQGDRGLPFRYVCQSFIAYSFSEPLFARRADIPDDCLAAFIDVHMLDKGLHAVAVEFQFMDETARTRNLAAQCGKGRLDEAREWCGLRARQRTGKEAGGQKRTRALHGHDKLFNTRTQYHKTPCPK